MKDIQLLKKFPFGTNGKKLTNNPIEITKKQFFPKSLFKYPFNNFKNEN